MVARHRFRQNAPRESASFVRPSAAHAIKLRALNSPGVPQIIRQLSQIEFEVSSPGEKRLVNNKTMKFSNQIYIYFDQNFSLRELSDVEAYFTSRGYSAIIRTNDYHVLHWSEFDRFSVGSTSESPTGAQLPKVDAGTQVSIKNRIGTEPFLSTDPPNPHPSAPAPRR